MYEQNDRLREAGMTKKNLKMNSLNPPAASAASMFSAVISDKTSAETTFNSTVRFAFHVSDSSDSVCCFQMLICLYSAPKNPSITTASNKKNPKTNQKNRSKTKRLWLCYPTKCRQPSM